MSAQQTGQTNEWDIATAWSMAEAQGMAAEGWEPFSMTENPQSFWLRRPASHGPMFASSETRNDANMGRFAPNLRRNSEPVFFAGKDDVGIVWQAAYGRNGLALEVFTYDVSAAELAVDD